MYFRYFVIISPLEKGRALYLKKLESPSTNEALNQVFLKLALWFCRRRFLNLSMYFPYFVIISPWKKAGPFIWTNLNTLQPMMFCAKFGCNWPIGSGEEDQNVKSLRKRQWRRQRTNFDQKSSLELKTCKTKHQLNCLCVYFSNSMSPHLPHIWEPL